MIYDLTFVSRNETYCVTGSIKLLVYEASSVDMEKLSYPILATVGENLTFRCPSIDDFNRTDRLIKWYKVRGIILCILAADRQISTLSVLMPCIFHMSDAVCSFPTGLQLHWPSARHSGLLPLGQRQPIDP